MEKDKNVHTIIKVVDALNKQGMKTKLCLVGSITDPSYKTLIDTHQNDIEWYDQCPKEQVLAHLRKNDIFIMPSYHETFGLVYAEAMSQGLPVIYTKGQGFDGFFEDGKVEKKNSNRNHNEVSPTSGLEESCNSCIQEEVFEEFSNIISKDELHILPQND